MKEANLWRRYGLGSWQGDVLNLAHPVVARRILAEIDRGVDVYYDQRWRAAEVLATLLLERRERLAGQRVLVLGCGVGIESLIAAALAEAVVLNDLSEVALELAVAQLRRNRLANYTVLPGRYEQLELPAVTLALGSFLVYDDDTQSATRAFLDRHPKLPVLLVNDDLPAFAALLAAAPRRWQRVGGSDARPCVLFPASGRPDPLGLL